MVRTAEEEAQNTDDDMEGYVYLLAAATRVL